MKKTFYCDDCGKEITKEEWKKNYEEQDNDTVSYCNDCIRKENNQ